MTTLEIVLLVLNAFWILAYMGATARAERYRQQADAALAQAERAIDQADRAADVLTEMDRAIKIVLYVNKKLYTMLAQVMERTDNDGEEWKRG